jgi:hypothetical protein
MAFYLSFCSIRVLFLAVSSQCGALSWREFWLLCCQSSRDHFNLCCRHLTVAHELRARSLFSLSLCSQMDSAGSPVGHPPGFRLIQALTPSWLPLMQTLISLMSGTCWNFVSSHFQRRSHRDATQLFLWHVLSVTFGFAPSLLLV